MALFSFCTTFEWSDIVAPLPDLVRQNGAVQVQLTLIDENGPSDATLTAATPMTGLRLTLGSIAKPWEDSGLTGHIANIRAFQVTNFGNQLILPVMGTARELGRVARTDHC
ncbi:helicase-like protein [Trypanosoma cruzi]|nr:helicase-like protein [Trypanosoma cruzi]